MSSVPHWGLPGDGWSASSSSSSSSSGRDGSPEVVRGHRRSRSEPGRADDEARLAEQRHRNKLSARMHRRRASEHLARLRQDVLCKEHEHAALAVRVASLEDCNRALRTRVHETWAQLASLLTCPPQPTQQPQPQPQQTQRLPSIAELVRSKSTALPHTIVLPALRDSRMTKSRKAEPDPAQEQQQEQPQPPTALTVWDDSDDGWDTMPCSLWPCTTPEWDTTSIFNDSLFAPAITTDSDPNTWF